jgi:hypothetical protein
MGRLKIVSLMDATNLSFGAITNSFSGSLNAHFPAVKTTHLNFDLNDDEPRFSEALDARVTRCCAFSYLSSGDPVCKR